jgi:hypothetical protein
MTLLLIIAAASFPMVFGQVVRLVTGTGPDDPEFLERYRKSLHHWPRTWAVFGAVTARLPGSAWRP